MKKIVLVLLTLSMGIAPYITSGQDVIGVQTSKESKKEQRGRERKEREAENGGKPKWPGLPEKMSGLEKVDNYIKAVNGIYTNVNNHTDRINFYTQKTVPLLDANGEQIKSEDGQAYLKTEITDKDGNNISITQLLLQLPDISLSLLGLTGDATNLVLSGVEATTELAANPLHAFSYGKYVKAGPGVLAYVGKEGGRLVSETNKQYDVLTKLRKSQVTLDYDLDINYDEAIINLEKDYAEATGIDDILKELEQASAE